MLAYCSVGTPAEHKSKPTNSTVHIGDRNTINEHTTINAGTDDPTFIGSDCYLMRGVHIGHDGYVDDQVTMSCNTILGGHSIIMKGANIGLGSAIHQFRVVGAYAMIGMMSNVVRSIPPFVIAVGNPAKPTKINAIGMQRGGVADLDVASAMQWMERGMDDSALSPHLKQIMDRWHSMYGACGK